MNLDESSVKRLLALNDAQLRMVLRRLAADYGVDLSGFSLGAQELAQLRSILSVANSQQIEQLLTQFPQVKERMQTDEK